MEKWTWLSLKSTDDTLLDKIISSLISQKFTGVNVSGSVSAIREFSTKAYHSGIKTNVWFWTLINTEPEICSKHPDWFNLSRAGFSSLTHPPYVGYYKWYCPNKMEVQDHILQRIREYCSIVTLAGIHLDYIRYPDVILPPAIQPKYGLKQSEEEPQFDFCYCDTCRGKFKQEFGLDPLDLKNPAADQNWLNFRLHSVNKLVNQISEMVHSYDKELSAAVFPHPELAIKLVRQDWTSWQLDAVFPMVYHKFYNKSINWLAEINAELINDYHYKIPLIPGIYLPDLSEEELLRIREISFRENLSGLSFFDYSTVQKRFVNLI